MNTSAAPYPEIRNPIVVHQITDVSMNFVPTFYHSTYQAPILVRRAIAFVNFTRWIGFCMSELFGEWTSAASCLERHNPIVVFSMICTQQVLVSTGVTFDIGSSRSLATLVTVDNRLPYAFMPIILLQHGHCTLVIILFGPFARLFNNLAMRTRALSPNLHLFLDL